MKVELRDSQKMTMVHLKFKTLILVLLLSLPAVLADEEVAMTNNDQALGNVKGLGYEEKVVVAAQSGSLRGRKIGVNDAMLKKEGRCENNAGKDMNSPTKSYATPNTEDSDVLSNTETTGSQKLLEATAEIFKMMNKDYHQKAHRRPPINNNLPVDGEKKDVAP